VVELVSVTEPIHLLVADESARARSEVARLVVECCHNVRIAGEACDHGDLFRLFRSVYADVLLMDLNMLGEAATDEVILRGSFGLGCILAMSARCDERAKAKARRYGATELLDKSRLGTTLQPAIDRWAALTRKPLWQ